MSDDEDFSKAPVSITELRSNRSGNSADWTVRDCLIKALRDFDNGDWTPDKICIIGGHTTEKSTVLDTMLANCSTLELFGVLELAKLDRYNAMG